MQLRRMGLLCGMLVLANSVPALASENGAPAKELVNILLTQEQQLQLQLKEVHQQILDTNSKIKDLDDRITKHNTQTKALTIQTEQVVKSMAQKYSIIYLPLAIASQNQTWLWGTDEREQPERHTAMREQLVKDKEQLQTKEKQVRERLRTVSDKIAKSTGTTQKEGSIEGLDLEKLVDLFAWPIPVTKEVSSDYGWRKLNGDVEFHTGIDVAADMGDPIHASADGVVLFAGPAQGFGNWIVIRHEQGLMTIYGHMYRNGMKVKPGQTVRKGDLIGKVGADGQSYGPHLHFAVATGMKGGSMVTVNPWSFMER